MPLQSWTASANELLRAQGHMHACGIHSGAYLLLDAPDIPKLKLSASRKGYDCQAAVVHLHCPPRLATVRGWEVWEEGSTQQGTTSSAIARLAHGGSWLESHTAVRLCRESASSTVRP